MRGLEVAWVTPREGPSLCEPILRSVPEWFGIEEATLGYIRKCGELPTAVARGEGGVAGFLTLARHTPRAAEIYCIAVHRQWHGKGVGTVLVRWVEEILWGEGVEYLQVKTMGPSKPNRGYAMTARFYEKCGFAPLEEIHGLWPGLPCMVYVKRLEPARGAPARLTAP